MASFLPAFVYGHQPARFKSDFNLSESVERLRAATTRSVFSSLDKQSASGTVNERRVSLQRFIPMMGNSFKPFFIGKFEIVNGRVVLTGRFTMIWITKAFMTLWFGFIVLWTLLATISVIKHPQSGQWSFPLFGVGMAVAGVALVKVGKWFARNDIAWLSQIIQTALSARVPNDHTFKPTAAKNSTPT